MLFNNNVSATPKLILILIMLCSQFGACIIFDDNDPASDYSTAVMHCSFNPDYVTPTYDSYDHEWRWYFDYGVSENAGIGVTLKYLEVTFYTLNGTYIDNIDYSSRIQNWFGSQYLPPYGTLDCPGTYWANSDGSDTGWQAVFTYGGVDDYGNHVSCTGQVTCSDGQQAAQLGCSFSPNPVNPTYDYYDYEWRWYFDWSVFETRGTGVTLQKLWLDFYDLNGVYLYSSDYSDRIFSWFGSNWIPEFGTLRCTGSYWVNTDGSGVGWIMRYTYEGTDVQGNTVSCSGSVTLNDAYDYQEKTTSGEDRKMVVHGE
ncbi:hypothetical protein ACFL27_05685 [candidate division CSSED10-310 bacterium]|uniref:Uncharacterized protein n=1 Tax=candidate division CSSED10-310 bacterium TaxID=2855610 RepID=A0ABV6YU02_UNCC1